MTKSICSHVGKAKCPHGKLDEDGTIFKCGYALPHDGSQCDFKHQPTECWASTFKVAYSKVKCVPYHKKPKKA